ncbi:CinA family protein [Desulfobotulus sp. H1]|uniref:CinA family protein n=1 Tax=Desulfobotulus pelophilus TaxID=2823377 RepID=A0ABT3N9K1_9BACT|nr:CinA family protein [Desulfobotulus pelophilus]MCW7754133.1 CinA family protein [Desulfobotulus pelophilus]
MMMNERLDPDDYAKEISCLLRRRGRTLALAESCTGGLMASLFTSYPGSSDFFKLSAVTYANDAKQRILGVRSETLVREGAVSEAVAAEMAAGARGAGVADLGLATTGIAGPGGGSSEKPVGMVCIGLADHNRTLSWTFVRNEGERRSNQRVFAALALKQLYHYLLEEN